MLDGDVELGPTAMHLGRSCLTTACQRVFVPSQSTYKTKTPSHNHTKMQTRSQTRQSSGTAALAAPALPSWDGDELPPSEGVPYIDKCMSKMLLALRDCTVADLALEIFDIAKERADMSAEKQLPINEATAMRKITEGGRNGAFVELLHSIPKNTIRAVILGTVAWQGIDNLVQRPVEDLISFYLGSGPGAYSVSLHVDRRRGWMTKAELGAVIAIMGK